MNRWTFFVVVQKGCDIVIGLCAVDNKTCATTVWSKWMGQLMSKTKRRAQLIAHDVGAHFGQHVSDNAAMAHVFITVYRYKN